MWDRVARCSHETTVTLDKSCCETQTSPRVFTLRQEKRHRYVKFGINQVRKQRKLCGGCSSGWPLKQGSGIQENWAEMKPRNVGKWFLWTGYKRMFWSHGASNDAFLQSWRPGGRLHLPGNPVCHLLLPPGPPLLLCAAAATVPQLWCHLRLEGPKRSWRSHANASAALQFHLFVL